MRVWIVSEGEPLPLDDEKVRLRRMGQLSEILAELGHEAHWFCSTFHHYKKMERFPDDKDIVYKENLIFHLLKGKSYKKNVSFARIIHHKKIAKKFLEKSNLYEKPDIIIATMAPLEFSEAAVQFGKKNNIPVIVDIRDLWPEIYNEVVPKWGRKIIAPYIELSKKKLKETLIDTRGIVAVTSGFLDYGLSIADMEKREFDRVFHTSYRSNEFISGKLEDDWASLGLSDSDFIVTFMGNFGKQFVVDPLIEAAEILKDYKDVKFVLCGLGEKFDYFKKKTEKLGNIVMPGWIEGKQIQTLLQNTKIGIAPYKDSVNFRLNAPNKFGEYLSYSLPVFLSVTGVMEDLVEEYSCGIVYLSALDLAEQIKTLYLDRDKQKKMSDGAYSLYRDKFDSETVYKSFAEYLLEVARDN